MKVLAIILLVCCGLGSSSVQAIECLTAPNRSEAGWWSWREIDGRKCWYKKVGAVPPKSEFRWPEQANEPPLTEAPAQQESASMDASEADAATPQIEVVRVKPVEIRESHYRLGEGRVRLFDGFALSGSDGIG